MKVSFKTTAEIIGHVFDIDGDGFWAIDAVATRHGFYIWRGWPEDIRAGRGGFILTRELADHLVKHDFSHVAADLPISDKPLRGFRKRMGVAKPHDKEFREQVRRNAKPVKFVEDIKGTRFKVGREIATELGVVVNWGMTADGENKSAADGKRRGHRYILTPELAATIREWRSDATGLSAKLPFDLVTLHGMRRELGLDWYSDALRWWAERLDDLFSLSPDAFAERHGKSAKTARDERLAIQYVRREMTQPETWPRFERQLSENWSDKRQDVKLRLGSGYSRMRAYRRAWRILCAAEALKAAAPICAEKPFAQHEASHRRVVMDK